MSVKTAPAQMSRAVPGRNHFILEIHFTGKKRPVADISCLKNNDLGNVCARPGLDNMLLS